MISNSDDYFLFYHNNHISYLLALDKLQACGPALD